MEKDENMMRADALNTLFGTVALTIFLVNRQSLSHGIENSQPLSISAQEQIMIFGQHKTEALFPASEF